MEFIYTALPLIGTQAEVANRSFVFAFRGREYKCEFSQSSPELLDIALQAYPAGITASQHRHLASFHAFVKAESGSEEFIKVPGASPVSFWVRNFDATGEDAVDLARHLNFYTTYFDIYNPTIDVLPPKTAAVEGKPRERYISSSFPKKIAAQPLESTLLHYWHTSRSGDPFRKFIYCYQILEYSAFYYIEDTIKKKVRRLLASPHIYDRMDELMMEILDHMQDSKIWTGDKIDLLLKTVVNPKLLWAEVQKNKGFFSKSHTFEGGFTIDQIVVEKETEETFCNNWHIMFATRIRKIRNALSHGKEQSMEAVISPTPGNYELIQPWYYLISIAAGEVMVYQRATI